MKVSTVEYDPDSSSVLVTFEGDESDTESVDQLIGETVAIVVVEEG